MEGKGWKLCSGGMTIGGLFTPGVGKQPFFKFLDFTCFELEDVFRRDVYITRSAFLHAACICFTTGMRTKLIR